MTLSKMPPVNGAPPSVRKSFVSLMVFWVVIFGSVPIAKTATVELGRPASSSFSKNTIDCNIRLSGTIEVGDLQKTLRKMRLFESTEAPTLCLDSPGGSYDEALIIAEFILNRHLSTAVEADGSCLSACVIIFLAGNISSAGLIVPARTLDVAGKVGFFAPYYEGLSAVERLMALGSGTLHPQFFPKTLMVDMFKFGQGKSFFIDTVGKAISYSVNVTGIREPQDFGDVSLEMLCDVCDNANHQNGQCVRESMQRDLSFGSYMNVSHITVSFLNYGPETGGQRCMVAMARASGDQVKGMVFQITGAGNQASFQSIFFYPWSTPLILLPRDTD